MIGRYVIPGRREDPDLDPALSLQRESACLKEGLQLRTPESSDNHTADFEESRKNLVQYGFVTNFTI